MSEPLNVKSFGATGNGQTDDTAAFEAAIDVAINGDSSNDPPIPPNTALYVPSGTYLVDALEALCDSGESFSIFGDSAGSSILKLRTGGQAPGVGPILYIGPTAEDTPIENVEVRHLQFDGSRSSAATPPSGGYALLSLWNLRYAQISHIRIRGSKSRGLDLAGDETAQGQNWSSNNSVECVIITACDDLAFNVVDSKFATLSDIHINNTQHNGLSISSTTQFASSGHAMLSNISFNEINGANASQCLLVHDTTRVIVNGLTALNACCGVRAVGTSSVLLSNIVLRSVDEGIVIEAEYANGVWKNPAAVCGTNIAIVHGLYVSGPTPIGIMLAGVSDSVFSNISIRQLTRNDQTDFSKAIWLRAAVDGENQRNTGEVLFVNVKIEACTQAIRIDDSSARIRIVNANAVNGTLGTGPTRDDLWCSPDSRNCVVELTGFRDSAQQLDLLVSLGDVTNFHYYDYTQSIRPGHLDVPGRVYAANSLFMVWADPVYVSGGTEIELTGQLHRFRKSWGDDPTNTSPVIPDDPVPVQIRLAAQNKVAENGSGLIIKSVLTGELLDPGSSPADTPTAVMRTNSSGVLKFKIGLDGAGGIADVIVAPTFLSPVIITDPFGPMPVELPEP